MAIQDELVTGSDELHTVLCVAVPKVRTVPSLGVVVRDGQLD